MNNPLHSPGGHWLLHKLFVEYIFPFIGRLFRGG